MALDERDFFNNRNESRNDVLTCPRCRRQNEYQMQWAVRIKKDRPPQGADERDRAKFAKLRDYMIRLDDTVVCKACRTKFDIPSQHSMIFLQPGEKTDKTEKPAKTERPPQTSGRRTTPATLADADEDEDDSRFNR